MFWGLILKSNKRYTQTLEKSFHLAQASLDTSTAGDGDVQVWFSNDEQTNLLCTLRKNSVFQKSLNLNFTVGDKVTFFTKGSGVVHLSGSLLPDGFDDFDSDDEEEENEELETIVDKPAKAKDGKEKATKSAKTVEVKKVDDDDDMDDGEEDGVESDDDDSDDDEDDEDDDDEDDSQDDDSAEEEEIQEQPKKKIKLDKNAAQNGLENGKVNTKEANKAKQANQNKQAAKGNKIVLQGGVVAVDRQVGNGKEAKAGKKVQVYYEGRLKDTNKIFDSSKQGPGFKFTLGRGEVIKGWDIGVAGMKVGGKRTLTIPANLAYGAKGFPPTIPSNATLLFDVELKNVF